MCIVTWHVSGRDFEVDGFVRRFPEMEEIDVWHRGERAPLRQVREKSGFSLLIFDGDGPSGAMRAVRQAFTELSEVHAALEGLDVRSELRIGLNVGSKKSFVPVLSFAAEDMAFLARLGVAVEVVGYPTSDEE
jgi:hypothetical protein